jgi:hypothetical protein
MKELGIGHLFLQSCAMAQLPVFVLDSEIKVAYSLEWTTGLMTDEQEGSETRLLYSIKKGEHIILTIPNSRLARTALTSMCVN